MFDAQTVKAILDRIRGVWEPAILSGLAGGPVRSGQLRRRVAPDLDWRTFSDTLKRLADNGLLTRTASADAQEVWYELTPAGQAVLELLTEMETWAQAHRQDVPGLLPGSTDPGPDLP
jgi:DNA-binding HxlR family transcriptional regulator